MNYLSRPAYSFVMVWLLAGVFLFTLGCSGFWYIGTQSNVSMQLLCERKLPAEINYQLISSTFLKQRSQALKQLQSVKVRQVWWAEDTYEIVFVASLGEVAPITDSDRSLLEMVAGQVDDLIQNPQSQTLKTSHNIYWKGILALGLILGWFILLLKIFPGPLLLLEFRYICTFDKVTNQATLLQCAFLRRDRKIWQLDTIQTARLDEEHNEDGVMPIIMLVFTSGEQDPLLSWRQIQMPRTQFARAVHRI